MLHRKWNNQRTNRSYELKENKKNGKLEWQTGENIQTVVQLIRQKTKRKDGRTLILWNLPPCSSAIVSFWSMITSYVYLSFLCMFSRVLPSMVCLRHGVCLRVLHACDPCRECDAFVCLRFDPYYIALGQEGIVCFLRISLAGGKCGKGLDKNNPANRNKHVHVTDRFSSNALFY